MIENLLSSLGRRELEAEIIRLRTALEDAGLDAQGFELRQAARDEQHRSDLAASRAETEHATRDAKAAHADVEQAQSDLTASHRLVNELISSRKALGPIDIQDSQAL